ADTVKKLESKGVKALALSADAGDLAQVRKAFQQTRETLGPITVLHWNAATPMAGDLLTAPVEELSKALAVGVLGRVAAVQESLPDLRAAKDNAAVLVTNGGFGLFSDGSDTYAIQSKSMGLAIANSAKHKTSRLLEKRLKQEGIYVGEVTVVAT